MHILFRTKVKATDAAKQLLCVTLISTLSVLSACSSKNESRAPEGVSSSEQRLYRDAQRLLRSSNFSQAIEQLERLEAAFPFGRYAEQAQLELIYARYMSFDLESARGAADRFIRLHPQHSSVDYAFYLKGLAAFNKNQSITDRLFKTDFSKRDMTPARDAYADFAQLLARYPNSQYAPDARQRMIYLRNLLARSELAVADYYLRRGAHVAAANRARYVLENYPLAEATPDALLVLIECNTKLGLNQEANNALRVLALNYPAHPSFDDSGSLVLADRIRNRDRSWTNLVTLGLLDRPETPPPLRIQQPNTQISNQTDKPIESVDKPAKTAKTAT